MLDGETLIDLPVSNHKLDFLLLVEGGYLLRTCIIFLGCLIINLLRDEQRREWLIVLFALSIFITGAFFGVTLCFVGLDHKLYVLVDDADLLDLSLIHI